MQVITNIPLNYEFEDDSLFEFIPIKRTRRSIDYSKNDSNYLYGFFKFLEFKNKIDGSSQ